MKTPEEIKHTLRYCWCKDEKYQCIKCPYNKGNDSCDKALDADALAYIQQLEDHIRDLTKALSAVLDDAPSVDTEPVRHGKWVEVHGMMPPEHVGRKRCSVCGRFALHDFMGRERLSFFCPSCGAKMDLEDEQ